MMDSAASTRHEGMPLPQAINTATRSIHTKLNKKILALLPLALPPAASNPSKYASGLLHIAAIYVTFEAAWESVLAVPSSSANTPVDQLGQDREAVLSTTKSGIIVSERIQTILSRLHLPKLLRSENLKADLRSVSRWDEETVDDQLEAVVNSPPLTDFLTHVRRSIALKPHVLIAYTYILYMALFAGGRFIRATLEAAGDRFWTPDNDHTNPETNDSSAESNNASEDVTDQHTSNSIPVSFLRFATSTDGEDLKAEFKQQLLDSEYELTGPERDDIVRESLCIFEHMIFLVEQLGSIRSQPVETSRRPSLFDLGQILNPLVARMRDSLSVAKERKSKDESMESTSTNSNTKSTIAQGPSSSRSNSPVHSRQSSSSDNTEQPVDGTKLAPNSKGVRFQAPSTLTDKPLEVNQLQSSLKASNWQAMDVGLQTYALAGTATVVIVAVCVGAFRTAYAV